MPDNKVTIQVGVVGMAAVASAFTRLGGGIQALQRLAIPLTGIITAASSGRAITAGIVNVAKLASNLDDLTRRTGGTAAKLVVLRQVFTDTGAGAESVGQKMNVMQREISDAAQKGGIAASTLTNIGLSARELSRIAPEEQFRILSERIGGLENPARRAAAVMDIFGKSGGELLPLFSDTGAIATATRALGKLPELLQRNLPVLDSISDSFGRLGIKKQQFFAGLLDQVGGGIKSMLDALEGIDLTGLGQRVGAFVNVAIDAWKEGKFSEFIGLTIRAGFEIGANAAKSAWRFLVNEIGISNSFAFVSIQIANEITKGIVSGLLTVGQLFLTLEFYLLSMIKTVLAAEFNLLKALINNLFDWVADKTEAVVNAAISAMNKIPGVNVDAVNLPRSNIPVNDVPPAMTLAESFKMAGAAVSDLKNGFNAFLDASTKGYGELLGVNKLLTGEMSAQNELAKRMQEQLQKRAWQAAQDVTSGVTRPPPTAFADIEAKQPSIIDEMIRALQSFGTVARQVGQSFQEIIGGAINSISSGIVKLINGTITWGNALREVGSSIMQEVIQSIVKMGVQFVVTHVLMRGAMQLTAVIAEAIGAKQAALSIRNFIVSSAAGAGKSSEQGGWVGLLIYMGVLAASLAAITAMAGGFAEGGFTGSGSKFEPAGVVHRGEFIIPADMTSRIGVPALESWLSSNGSGSPAGAPTVNNDNRTKVAIFDDRAAMRDWLRSTEGRELVLDIMSKEGHRVMRS